MIKLTPIYTEAYHLARALLKICGLRPQGAQGGDLL